MIVRGASRTSFAGLTEQLEAENITSATVATRLGNELFAVVGLLDAEHGLRRALSDPGKPAAEKAAVASALLHGKVTGRTEALVVAAVESRWATSGDMVDAIEQLAIEALVLTAEAENGLDDLEDGLFRFGRVVAAQPELRAALATTSLPAGPKEQLLSTLLRGKVTSVTLRLITQMVTHPRGRALPAALGAQGSFVAIKYSFTSIWPITIAGYSFPGYTALYTLVFNILIAVALTPLFNAMRDHAKDETVPADYRAS